jgi:hypothetical protein
VRGPPSGAPAERARPRGAPDAGAVRAPVRQDQQARPGRPPGPALPAEGKLAIGEAVQRPQMRFVPIKSAAQLDLQALHRARDRLVTSRTGLINQIRAFLLERGITVRPGRLALDVKKTRRAFLDRRIKP